MSNIMSPERREDTISRMASQMLDAISMEDLEQFYFDYTTEWLNKMSDEEIVVMAYGMNIDLDD